MVETTPASPKSMEWLEAVEHESNPALGQSVGQGGRSRQPRETRTTPRPGPPGVTSRWQTAQSAAATAGETSRKIGKKS